MKRILTAGLLWLCSTPVCAQVDTSTPAKLIHYIMQPMDKSQVPTGFLSAYGCPILPMTA